MSKIIGVTVGTPTSPKAIAEQLNPVTADELPGVIESALAQAKASGKFDGEDGKTPEKGVDYWTEKDKAEIKAYVDEAILGGEW